MTILEQTKEKIGAIAGETNEQLRQRRNVGGLERALSVIAGTSLALFGLKRRSWGGLGLASLGGALLFRGSTGFCNVYQALGINTADDARARQRAVREGVHVERSVTINRPVGEVYSFWRNFGNLPQFMNHVHSVEVLDSTRSHWVVSAPAGATVEWDAEIVSDRPNELISWRSLEKADVDNAGSVIFKSTPSHGTEVKVTLRYSPPAGKVGTAIAKLFGQEPKQQIAGDLRRLKQLLETGEIPTIEGQPRGQCK